jgi:hypothetical protein
MSELGHAPQVRQRRASLGAIALGASLLVATAGVVAAGQPVISRTIDIHFEHTQHFDGNPACGPFMGGVTETATGNSHVVAIDQGDSFSVTFGETFKILAVPDDPSFPTTTRQGTDAAHFRLLKDGTTIFHESFHDFGLAAWDPNAKIQLFTTVIYRDGQVVIDHTFGRDLPPPGC